MANSFDAMKVATESLANTVMRRATHNNLWLSAIPRGTYANNTGLTQTTFTVENSLPTDDTESWNSITLSTGADSNFGACADSYTDANVGFSERSYSPSKFLLRGPIVCETDLLFQHIPKNFLDAYVGELVKRSQKSWENKVISEYMKFAEKHVVSSTATLSTDTTIDELEDVSLSTTSDDLEQGHLDTLAARMIENGATAGDSNGFINLEANGPVFPLVIGMEASAAIAKNNSDLREDYRYGEPNELLKRLGASRVIGNFRHVPTTMPIRLKHNSTTGKFERVNQYVESSATKGKKSTINPDWRDKTVATHEVAIVLNPSVMTTEVVAPQGYGLSFDPKNYSGDWQWITGGDRIGATSTGGDPQGKLGRHFATYMAAWRPVRPEDGAVIIFAR